MASPSASHGRDAGNSSPCLPRRAQVYIDLIALGAVRIFVPELAASFPWPPDGKAVFDNVDGAALAVDSFATRQIAWGFLLHGLVRAGAGFRGAADPTLAALAACSYALEAAMFFREVTVHGTVSDPVPMYVLPFFAVACAALARGGKAKTA